MRGIITVGIIFILMAFLSSADCVDVETCESYNPSIEGNSPSYVCGDGFIEQGVEQCDDKNFVNGDGCSLGCAIEDGWYLDPLEHVNGF